MVETKSLTYAYDAQNQFVFPDIRCAKQEHCLILGPSGKGKSTLLHLLSGLIRPKSGQLTINDVEIAQLSTSKMDAFRGKHIGIIFQKNHFIRALTVKENLMLTQKLSGEKKNAERIDALLARLNISEKANTNPSRLSQGEQQRVAIARALVSHPSIILADEPTSALDDGNCERVFSLLKEQADAEGATLIIVTHDNRLKSLISKQYTLN